MKKIAIIIITLFCIIGLCKSEEINEDWIKSDSIFISHLKIAYQKNPLSIEKQLEPWEMQRANLGFGYSSIEHSMGKGYVSIFYTLVYKDKKLISYRLEPKMPRNSQLIKRYLSFYEGMFEIKDSKAQVLYFGYKNVSLPLEISKPAIDVSKEIKYFMTPYSGIIYGDYGGIANSILENREAFNLVKDSINENILIYLLKSINPATRMCAAEEYYQNKESYQHKDIIEKLIEINLKELPKIKTMSSCLKYEDNAKDILNRMIGKNKHLSIEN